MRVQETSSYKKSEAARPREGPLFEMWLMSQRETIKHWHELFNYAFDPIPLNKLINCLIVIHILLHNNTIIYSYTHSKTGYY